MFPLEASSVQWRPGSRMRSLCRGSHRLAITVVLLSVVNPAEAQNQNNVVPTRNHSSEPRLTIIKPDGGTTVAPGDILHIEVSPPVGVPLRFMGIEGTLGISNEFREAPPYSFTLTVPIEDRVGGENPLIGKHTLYAAANAAGTNEGFSASIEVDVEEPSLPLELSVATQGSQYGPPHLDFYSPGQEEVVRILGEFRDHRELDVTASTYLKLFSGDSRIVVVEFDGANGRIISVGPGATNVLAEYSHDGQTVKLRLPVSVEKPRTGLVAEPTFLQFGEQPVGTSSDPQRVTITNLAAEPVVVDKLKIPGDFVESDDCSDVPLAAEGGTCTITVTFKPSMAGPQKAKLDLQNNFYSAPSILLFGNGVKTP